MTHSIIAVSSAIILSLRFVKPRVVENHVIKIGSDRKKNLARRSNFYFHSGR